MRFLGVLYTTWFFGFLLMSYLAFAFAISSTTQKVWREQRANTIMRMNKGEDVCLELIMVDVSMSIIILTLPILQIVKALFCKKHIKRD